MLGRGAGNKAGLLCSVVALAVAATGCGGGDDDATTTTAPPKSSTPSQSLRAAAVSLQSAMDASARAIDGVRGTRSALDRLHGSLQPTIAQTGDVVVLLTPTATEPGTATDLLNAARDQRSFLEFAMDAADARSLSAANNALTRAQQSGRQASDAYSQINQSAESGLAGLLPAATTFNIGRLRDAVRTVNKKQPEKSPSTGTTDKPTSGGSPAPSTPPAASSTSCGDGISVNSVTTCPFAQNVRDEYRASGGSSVIQVYSPVTKQLYTLTCSGGVPTVCRGGNGAEVTFR